jgi:hypothetical protein
MIKQLNYYSNDGWGLCVPTLEMLINIIKNNNIKNIIEFGSGKSTEFLIDVRNEFNLDYTIDSFDNSEVYCYKGEQKKFLQLNICNLISCDDIEYENIFSTKKFDKSNFTLVTGEFDAKIKNATYDIKEEMLKTNYDLVIIDGPHGNGRNFNNFYIENRIRTGSFIVVDDFFHYDFIDKIKLFFNVEIIESQIFEKYRNKGHAILKVI